jgi:hypothetical protein
MEFTRAGSILWFRRESRKEQCWKVPRSQGCEFEMRSGPILAARVEMKLFSYELLPHLTMPDIGMVSLFIQGLKQLYASCIIPVSPQSPCHANALTDEFCASLNWRWVRFITIHKDPRGKRNPLWNSTPLSPAARAP